MAMERIRKGFHFYWKVKLNKLKKYIIDYNIRSVEVKYLDFNNDVRYGTIEVHRKISREVIDIFDEIFNAGFKIEKINPISLYDYSDKESVLNNNTSGYNFRKIKGTNKLSSHSFGFAIDINPKQNPYVHPKAFNFFTYDPLELGAIIEDSKIVDIFKSRNWTWGGDWKYPDYQHFQKNYKVPFWKFWLKR